MEGISKEAHLMKAAIWRHRRTAATKKWRRKITPKQQAKLKLEEEVRGLPERVVESPRELDNALAADRTLDNEHNLFPPKQK
jgi:DNA-binding transcriptional regulator GbsR (MarR family)